MMKAFISHSSVQKDFAQELVKEIGRDFCYIDCYDFQAGNLSKSEIEDKITKSDIFVLLISRESLDSDWVRFEMRLAQDKYKTTPESIFPAIIDDTSWDECSEWSSYNLKRFKTPYAVAREVEYRFRKLDKSLTASLRSVMVGRNADIDRFEKGYFSRKRSSLRCCIVSGRKGIGRESFVSQCLRQIRLLDTYSEPFKIELPQGSGLEELILFLNNFSGVYSINDLNKILRQSTLCEKNDIAVKLINDIYNTYNTPICLYDNGACILHNRELSTWIIDIIQSTELSPMLGLFIVSRIAPKTYIHDTDDKILHIPIQPLGLEDRRKLFYSLLNSYQEEDKVKDEDVDFFIERLLYSPLQIYKVVRTIHENTLPSAKREIDDLISIGDEDLREIITSYQKKSNEIWEVFLTLSSFEFISRRVLIDFFPENKTEIEEVLKDLAYRGMVSEFGRSGEFIKMDHSLRDYIKRAKIEPSKDLKCYLEEITEKEIDRVSHDEDISLFFSDIERAIRRHPNALSEVLFPSIILKAIRDAYNNTDYSDVVSMCRSILKDAYQRFSAQIILDVVYWYASALARLQDEEFWTIVKDVKDDSASYFLKGFYKRIEHQYPKAEEFLRKALSVTPNMQQAKRELVTALMEQNKYSEAREMARDNYTRNRTNPYHIYACFRCEIQASMGEDLDFNFLHELKGELERSHSNKRDELLVAMELELSLYSPNTANRDSHSMIKEAQKKFPDSDTIRKVIVDFSKRRGNSPRT